jgi:predicted nucleic acid-binding protein
MRIVVAGQDVEKTPYAAQKVLLDTNVLVYAHNKSSPDYTQASCILIASTQGSINAYVSDQNLLEFYSVMTNSSKVTPCSPLLEVQEICIDLWESRKIRKVYPKEKATIEAIRIAAVNRVKGAQIFDCAIALTARDNHVDYIWTDNVSGFKQLGFVNAENPLIRNWQLIRNRD